MASWALIRDGAVQNTVVWDGVGSYFDGYDAVIDITNMENAPGRGWLYQDGAFIEPPLPKPSVPRLITRRQCALELLSRQMITDVEALNMTRSGATPSIVTTYIQALPTDQQIRAEIDFAAENYYRSNELLIAMMSANDWSSDDIDDFFIAANKL